MAAVIASVNMATAVPMTSCAVCSYSSDSAVHISSAASFAGKRLTNANGTAHRSVSRASRTLTVRAGEKAASLSRKSRGGYQCEHGGIKSLWDTITGLFDSGKKKASEAASQGEKELNKASSEAKSSSGDLGNKAESLKEDLQAKAEVAADNVKTEVEDLKEKAEEAVESAKTK